MTPSTMLGTNVGRRADTCWPPLSVCFLTHRGIVSVKAICSRKIYFFYSWKRQKCNYRILVQNVLISLPRVREKRLHFQFEGIVSELYKTREIKLEFFLDFTTLHIKGISVMGITLIIVREYQEKEI